MPLQDLNTPSPAVALVAGALDTLDDAFVAGFGRLSSEHLAALGALQRSFGQTPLAQALAEAVAGIGRSEFIDRHFLVLAAARSAAYGALHDALLAQACAALGRPLPTLDDGAPGLAAAQAPPPNAEVLMESTRHWLMELAIAGFANLGVDLLLPFQATLDAIEAEPTLGRQAAFLGGFLGELMSVFPCQGTPEIPRLRWVDLWCRAMVLGAAAPEPLRARPVSGELRLLGADLRQHSNAANLVVYASLREKDAPPRLVRVHLTAFKVDVIQGEELGPLLGEPGGKLLAALGGGLRVEVKGMTLTPTSDLLWDDGKAALGQRCDPLEEAQALLAEGKTPALRPCLAPADRHPVLLDELVYLPRDACMRPPLPLDAVRMGDDIAALDLAGTKGLVALLRFDGGAFSIQPLCIDKGKGARMNGAGLAEGLKKAGKNTTLATLKERAGKLLRKKS